MGSEGLLTRENGAKTVVEVTAPNVDFRNCETIKTTVAGVVGNGRKAVVLNLSQVNFMDSSGLGVVLYCKRACESAGGSFSLCGLKGYVSNLVRLTNLDKAVPIYDSEDLALES
jgi:anti-sigma B factor antagonist